MNHTNIPHFTRVNRIGSALLILLTIMLSSAAWGQDKSKDILLVHASTLELGSNGYSFSSDVTIDYIAEFLWGLLAATDGYGDAQVDYASEGDAHSLADIYYDPEHSDLKASIGSGYRNVILFESEQASAYPEVMYEGCKQLSKTVLEAGGTPLLMMFRSDHIDAALYGEYAYRAGNGCGVEVVPAGYAIEDAGLWGKQVSTARVKQAWLSACAIYSKITGLDPALTGYAPAYEHLEWSNAYYIIYLSSADIASLRTYATNAVNAHRTTQHYSTSYELDGSVVYRTIDVSAAPFNDTVKYFYKGSSTHEFTSERINTILDATENDPLAASVHFLGNQTNGTRDWTSADLTLRADTFLAQADKGLFLFVGGSQDGANAQDIIDSNQANLVPMVFDWIKSFGSTAGTATTTSALNEQDCADLWDHYYLRGWKTIPTTIGLGRLNEKIPNFVACEDLNSGAHSTDPLLYMNASMMLASSLGTQMNIPATLPIRRGTWTHAELTTAIETGHDLVKELAYRSETSAFVPDSDLAILTESLPEVPLDDPYSFQLTATGGDASYTWELISDSGLPDGLSLSANGLLSGTVTEATGTRGVAFKVTDGAGAFRKVGLKLSTALPVGDVASSADVVATTNTNYGTDVVAIMYSAVLTAPDQLATFRIAISVDPMAGTSITSQSGGLWGINSGEGASGWWSTFDGSLSQAVDSVSNIQIVDFNANGGGLTLAAFTDLSFKSVTVTNGNNSADRVKVVAGGVANATNGQKMASSPATIDLEAIAGTTVSSFTLANGNIGNSSDRWNIMSIEVGYTIQMPSDESYASWASDFGLVGNDGLEDADVENGGVGDGYANLLEYALGMDPTLADAGSKESMFTEEEGASKYFVYEYERRTDYLDRGLIYTLVMTPDLVTPSLDPPYDVNVGDPVDGFQTVTTRYLIEGDSKFVKLQVQAE